MSGEVPGPGHYRINHGLQDNHAHSRSPNLAWGPTRPQSAPQTSSSGSSTQQPGEGFTSEGVSKGTLLSSTKGVLEGTKADATISAAAAGEGTVLEDPDGAEPRETTYPWGLKAQPVHPKRPQRRPGSACFMVTSREQRETVLTERYPASASHHNYYHPGYDTFTRPASGATGPW